MIKIYLVRHGENVANLTKEFSHRKVDHSLTPKGRLQAEQIAAYFKDIRIITNVPPPSLRLLHPRPVAR